MRHDGAVAFQAAQSQSPSVASPVASMAPTLPPASSASPIWQTYRFARHPTSFLDEMQRRYGDIFVLRFVGTRPWVCLSNPQDLKAMYSADAEVLRSGLAAGSVFAPLTGWNASLTLDGRAHRARRRAVLPNFAPSRVAVFAAFIRDCARASLAGWPNDHPFALHPYLQAIALRVIMAVVFGFTSPPDRLLALIEQLGRIGMNSPLLFAPRLQWNLGRFSPWGRILHIVRATRTELLREISVRRAAGGERQPDVFSALLHYRDSENEGLSDDEVCDELIALLIAGYETTHIATCWVFERVLSCPGILQRLAQELAAAPDVSGIAGLRYLDAVVRESLRVRPVSPICGGRLATAPFRIGGYELPPGVILTNCSYLLHRRSDVYPDADAFRPERFLEGRPAAHEMTTFGGGDRQCIGNPLALLEVKVVLATVIENVELRLASPPVKAVARGVHLVPEDGLKVVIAPSGPGPRPGSRES
jgi:cytochrome P450